MAQADEDLTDAWQALETQARAELARQGVAGEITLSRLADARYAGQSHELRIVADAGADLAQLLHRAHREAYGYAMPDEPVWSSRCGWWRGVSRSWRSHPRLGPGANLLPERVRRSAAWAWRG